MASRTSGLFFAASVAEMAAPAQRPKLWFGIWSGFAISVGFGLLAAAVSVFDLSPHGPVFGALVAVKLATNTIAWLALRNNRAVMETQGLNSIADVVLLTIAAYYSGGPYSPLLPTYVILIAVLALLTNLGVTLLMAGFIVMCFSTMVILMAAGVLPPTPVPGTPGGVPSTGYTVTAIFYCAVVVGVPTYYATATVRLLRRKEADLEKRTRQLIQEATQRSQFVASMTHELRTPIHGIQGLSDVIAAGVYGPVTDRQREACASVKRSAQSLLELVDEVLQLARADAGKIEARPGPVDVAGLVERVTGSVSWVIGTKQVNLTVDIAPELPELRSDERWLAHVLVNLLANAVKFTPEGGVVTIRARSHPGDEPAVLFVVEDTGIGIAPEDREAIFEPFRQAQAGDDKGFGGVGLGLALVARLTDLLGARVELESQIGKGSTFRVIVPVAWRGRPTTQVLRAVRPPSVLPSGA
jgi:signal transduction histidine kinase